MRYSDKQLLDEIRRLNKELGHPPTLQEARERAEFGVTTYYERFGSWRKAIDAAGFEPREPQSEIPDEDLLEELTRLADESDERPSVAQMNDHGKYWASTYKDHFGSWTAALEAAGFDTSNIPDRTGGEGKTGPPVEEETLLEDLKQLGKNLERRPTWDDMAEQGDHSPNTYVRRFGAWSNALEAAGFEPPKTDVSREELLEDLRSLADELGHIPTTREMNAKGKHSPNTYSRRLGSWSNALDLAFEEGEYDSA